MKLKRMTAALLLLAMLLSCLPLSVLAADAEPVEAEEAADVVPAEEIVTEEAEISTQAVNASGYFYFSAETANKLLIAPTRIAFTDGQTIREALNASKYSFTTDDSSGFITAIEGERGNYTYGSAPADASLDSEAGAVTYFRFSENTDSTPSSGLQTLMQVMADYLTEEADVQNAAADEYQAAVSGYLGVASETAQRYAAAITARIDAYQNGQNPKYAVTFSGYSGDSYTVSAVNDYGKQFTDPNHTGTLQLPAGGYTFSVRQENRMVSGRIKVTGPKTVTASLPSGDWFNESSLKISSGYDAEFDANCYAYTLTDHTATVQVPDSFTGRLYPYFELSTTGTGAKVKAVYTDVNGEAREKDIPAKSRAASIDNALSRGAAGSTVILRASKAGSDDYTQSVDLALRLDRMPTLGSLRVTNAAGTPQAAAESFSSTKTAYTYKILNSEKTLIIYPTATVSGSSVTVNGNELDADGSVTVTISGETTVTIQVSSGEYMTAYTLTIQPGQGRRVTFNMAADVTLTVVNKNGEELAYTKTLGDGNTINYLYTLVPGEAYSYVATQGKYYHAKKSFTLGSSEAIQVSVKQEDWLETLDLGNAALPTARGNLKMDAAFDRQTHEYTLDVLDASNALCVWIKTQEGACRAIYSCQSAARDSSIIHEEALTGNQTAGSSLPEVLLPGSAYGNTVTFRVSSTDKSDGVTYYVDYVLRIRRTLSLKDMTVSLQDSPVTINRKSGTATGFSGKELEYTIRVPAAASLLNFTFQKHTDAPRYGDDTTGYEIALNGTPLTSLEHVPVKLNGTEQEETIRITVTNRFAPEATTDYTITVQKAATTAVRFRLQPADAQVYLYEAVSQNRVWPNSDGAFPLSEGFTYICSFTRAGYAGRSGSMELTAENGQKRLTFEEDTYTELSAVPVTLQAAKENPRIEHDLDAEWANFRGTDSNNGITNAKTPVSAEDSMLYWASSLGNGWDTGAVSNPILVDDSLIVYAGSHIYRVNKATGAIEATGDMAGTSSFAINGPTYADGIVLVGLSNGRIQAFNAKTLESLWLYTDPLGGQPDCPITVLGDYAYTGFWNGETKNAGFVCISLTDENPDSQTEEKAASWRTVRSGGFYWAGAYACENYVMIGTDDGDAGYKSDTASLLLLEPKSGALLDSMDGFTGDIRSSICYDEATNAFYFTSKGGYLYSVQVQKDGTSWKLANRRQLPLGGMSTSTPVVYNGRAYIGVSGTGQFTAYSGQNITVVDLENWEIAYSAQTQGYPQTSGLLTTAYEQENEYVYVYFIDNYTPGKLRVLRDRPGQTAADYRTEETFSGKSYWTAYALFTPFDKQAQYAICSPITDSDGTLYFKNDSGYLMAFGRSIEKIEVTKQPNRTQYTAGESFDRTGMVVTATLSDGSTRNVTDMVSAPSEPLTGGTEEITLEFGRGQTMYRNLPDGNKMSAGNKLAAITATIPIRVGDAAGSGTLTDDIAWSFQPSSNTLSIDGEIPEGHKVLIACYDENRMLTKLEIRTISGSVTLPDSARIRVFYIDADSRPLCGAAKVLG